MDKRHPNTAEEVVQPFMFIWITEHLNGRMVFPQTWKISVFLFVNKPCKKSY
jgi:hypothetical protein